MHREALQFFLSLSSGRYLLKEILEKLLQDVVESIEASEETYPLLVQKKAEVVNTILMDFEDKLQEIATCDKKNFSIPPHVLLPEHFQFSKNYKVEDLDRLDADVSLLKQTFLEVNSFNYVIKEFIEEIF